MRRDLRRRILAVVALVSGLLVVLGALAPSPASAHSAPNSPSSNFVSTVTAVTPTPSTFTVKTIEATSRLELRWLSGPLIEIADYDGYPYLRVGPDGVEENQQSFAVYLNKDRNGATAVPDNLKPEGPPEWKKISSESIARWHDHRVHWMGGVRPDGVIARPNERQEVQPFSFPVTQGGQTYTVSGKLEWVPGPSPVPLLLLSGAVALVVLASALWAGLHQDRRMKVRLAIAASALALLAVDAAHLVGIAFGVHGPASAAFARMLSVGFVSIVAWAVLLVGAVLVIRRRFDAYYLLVLGAGLVTVIGGVSDFSVLSRSNAPFAFSLGLLRVLVALTLGLGIGVVVACVLLTRRTSASIGQPVAAEAQPVSGEPSV